MLGLRESRYAWSWCVQGKHPAARDFIRLGESSALAARLCSWLDSGYAGLTRLPPAWPGQTAWRFWARGGARGELACGVLQDSRDSIGRPYPLLVLGWGPVPGWEENWQLAVAACRESWWQMLRLSCEPLPDLMSLSLALSALPAPAADWERFAVEARQWRCWGRYWDRSDRSDQAVAWHRLEKDACAPAGAGVAQGADRQRMQRSGQLPNALFIGGVPQLTRHAVFWRPLNGSDFRMLWSEPPFQEGSHDYGSN